MGTDVQAAAGRVREELEGRGASAVAMRGHFKTTAFTGEQEDLSDMALEVEYDGDPSMLGNVVSEVDEVILEHTDTEAYPGGDVHVSGNLLVVEGGSPGATPGGGGPQTPPQHPNSRSSTTPVDPPEVDQDPHVPPGGTWAIRDENGIPDHHEVEAWPVRMWEPRPDVPAVSMLRYIPAPEAEGLEWWGGYVLLASVDLVGSAALYGHMKERLRETRITYEGHEVPLSYHDDEGWMGWIAADPFTEVANIPTHSSVGTDMAELDHIKAAEVTEKFAQAALDIRREVL